MTEPVIFPSISIIVEWENAKNSELGRAHDMLVSVISQLKTLSNRFAAEPEMILVYDAEHGAAVEVLETLGDELAEFNGKVQVVQSSGDYYEQKNLGAAQAKNDLILFVDSDVVPEAGWLENLICALVDENADVSAGCAHMPTDSLYEKSFAAFWFFPVRGEYEGRQAYGGFSANNVLFRASVARTNPFPHTAQVRGRCLALARSLLESGHKIVLEPSARVTHPAPNGVSHFVRRSLCEGQSQVFKRPPSGDKLIALKQFYWNLKNSKSRIRSTRKILDLSKAETAGAISLAALYYAIALLGDLVTLVSPNAIRDHVRV